MTQASAKDIGCSFVNVAEDVLDPFKATASELVDKFGTEGALCRALAIISGHTKKINQRSLLWAVEGYITVVMRVKTEITAMSYIWNILRRQFSQNLVDGVKGIKLLKDRHGAAFDIPESLRPEMAESADGNNQNRSFTVEFPKELPELAEEERSFARPGQQPYYGRGGYGQANGGYDRRGGSVPPRGAGGYGRGQSHDAGADGQRRRYGDKGGSQNKLFVGNLSYNTDDVALRDTFSDAGFNVVDSFVIRGTPGSPRRCDQEQQRLRLRALPQPGRSDEGAADGFDHD